MFRAIRHAVAIRPRHFEKNSISQPMLIELTSELSSRQWRWICEEVGEERAKKALSELNGRKPWPLNVANVLKLRLPHEKLLPFVSLAKPSGLDPRTRLTELREKLQKKIDSERRYY